MFPFSLAGPDFLGLYIVLSVLVLGGTAIWISEIEAEAPRAKGLLSDPYEIAYLRAGAAEAARVALVSLIDRGLIRRTRDAFDVPVLAPGEGEPPALDHPLEQRIVAQVAEPIRPDAVITAELLRAVEDIVTPPLEARGLLRGPRAGRHRVHLPTAAWAILTLIFVVRVGQAIASEHTHLGYLFLIWIGNGILALLITHTLSNAAATKVLEAMGKLLEDLRQRAGSLRPGRAPNELALLAAVFGLAALPALAAPYARDLDRATQPRVGGCGSSGGCGGGGDGGGGCGGCGGGCGGG